MTPTLPAPVPLGELSFDPPLYLAPMEGVTDRTFRHMILQKNGGSAVGAACTEFQRVSQVPLPLEVLEKELGPKVEPIPVGIQLMGNQPEIVAATAIRAAEAGADFVDLNFGCPAPRVFQHCAGSALLAAPSQLEAMVRATVDASPIPVTAKIRAGVEHDQNLEELAQRIEQAGAQLLTIHARLRIDRYQDDPNWDYIRRVKAAVKIPVFGNGNAFHPDSIQRMFQTTNCDGVMIGRGAMRDPLLFRRWSAQQQGQKFEGWTRQELAEWLTEYHQRMLDGGTLPRHALGRVKQAVKALVEGGWLAKDQLRIALQQSNVEQLFSALGLV